MYTPQPYVYQSPIGTNPPALSPDPWFKRYRRQLTIGAAVLGIVLVIVLVVVFFIHRFRANRAVEEKQEAQIQTQIEHGLKICDEATHNETCLWTVRQDLAQSSGDINYCDGLEGDTWNSCVMLAVLTSKNASDCHLIDDDEKEEACVNAVAALVPAKERTLDSCAAFTNGELRQSCERNWSMRQALEGKCDERVDEVVCAAGTVTIQAIVAEDPDICQQISDTGLQETCLEKTLPGDRDHDGLSADVEASLGTDDRKSDTDGDGFDDAMEINSGYNPLGIG